MSLLLFEFLGVNDFVFISTMIRVSERGKSKSINIAFEIYFVLCDSFLGLIHSLTLR